MAVSYTYLQAVNTTLKRGRWVQGDSGELATSTVTSTATGLVATGAFTNAAYQNVIDIALQIWNETFHEVFSLGNVAPEVATATLTFVTAQREYALPSDFERFAGRTPQERCWRMATRQFNIYEYPGTYGKMLADQSGLASTWQGLPDYYVISPVVSQTIRFDKEPTSNESGWTLNALYDKRMSRSSTQATDTMPFSDTVTDALVPVVAEGINKEFKKEFDPVAYRKGIVRALEYAGQVQRRTSYGPSR